jgi:hypothetical protein
MTETIPSVYDIQTPTDAKEETPGCNRQVFPLAQEYQQLYKRRDGGYDMSQKHVDG